MKFVEVKELPEKKRSPEHKYDEDIERFMAMCIKFAKVVIDLGEYASVYSAYTSLYRHVYPAKYPVDV